MRWQEEVTLTGYEMQWTVRHFRYMSHKWIIAPDDVNSLTAESSSCTGTGIPNLSIGAIAYFNRKHAVWEDLMRKADNVFKICNPAYVSPL
jgi:hypothetical protein